MSDTISFEREPKSGLVSIVIPTHNGARFIRESLASVALQTYSNWEVIVVEDGSDDGTNRIVAEFARKHRWHRVEYSRNEQNCGPSHSRNLAFRSARGEFVALLDVDDRWMPDHLQTSVDALVSADKDIAYSSSIMIEDGSDLLLGIWGPTSCELERFPTSLFGRSFITPSATVMRRQVLADVGPWDTALRYCEDLAFWFRCVGAGKKFQYVPGVHCLYRKNHASAATHRICETIEAVANVTERFMKMDGVRHSTTQNYTAKNYWMAAKYHRDVDPKRDPSVDRSRVAPLMLRAWQLRRRHIDWLLKGTIHALRGLLRRDHRQVARKPVVTSSGETQRLVAA